MIEQLNELRLAIAGRFTMDVAATGQAHGVHLTLREVQTGRISVIFVGEPQEIYTRALAHVTQHAKSQSALDQEKQEMKRLLDERDELKAKNVDLESHLKAAQDMISALGTKPHKSAKSV